MPAHRIVNGFQASKYVYFSDAAGDFGTLYYLWQYDYLAAQIPGMMYGDGFAHVPKGIKPRYATMGEQSHGYRFKLWLPREFTKLGFDITKLALGWNGYIFTPFQYFGES